MIFSVWAYTAKKLFGKSQNIKYFSNICYIYIYIQNCTSHVQVWKTTWKGWKVDLNLEYIALPLNLYTLHWKLASELLSVQTVQCTHCHASNSGAIWLRGSQAERRQSVSWTPFSQPSSEQSQLWPLRLDILWKRRTSILGFNSSNVCTSTT